MLIKTSRLPRIAWFLFLCLFVCTSCSNDPEKRKVTQLKKAMVYLDEHKEKEAIIELRNAIQTDPQYAQAHYQLGLLYLKTGEARLAFEEFQRTAALDPNNFDAKIKTAEFYVLAKRYGEAKTTITEVLKLAPDNADALALMANLDLFENKVEAALTMIDKAIANAPQEDRFYGIRGRILVAQQRFAEAEASLQKAIELGKNKMANHLTLTAFYFERKEFEKAQAVLENMAILFPTSAQPYLQLASFELSRNNPDAAEKQLQKALQVEPKNSKLKVFVAEFYTNKGKLEQAEQLYKEAITLAENKAEIEGQLADFYFDHGKFDQAKAIIEHYSPEREASPTIKLVGIKFLLKDGKGREAMDAVSTLTRNYPKWGELLLVKAMAHISLNEMKQAKESLLEALKQSPALSRAHSMLAIILLQEGDYDNSRKEAVQALKLNPYDFQAALTMAKCALLAKDYPTAEQMFSTLRDKVPDNIEVMGSLGLTYMAMQQQNKAKQEFEQLLQVQPGNAKALALLLQIAQKEGSKPEALIAMVDKQIEKAPNSSELYIVLGDLYQNGNQPDKALSLFQKAQQLAPNDPQAYILRAMLLTKQGHADQAIAEYQALITKQPRAISGYMGLGNLYEQGGQTDQAMAAYKKVLEISPDFAPAANNLAWMLAESKNPDLGEALRLAMLAKQQQPDDPQIIDTLGWVHYKRGSFTLARNEFALAVQKQADLPVLRYHLALALFGEGKKAEALKELEKSLAAGGTDFQERGEAEATLQQWRNQK